MSSMREGNWADDFAAEVDMATARTAEQRHLTADGSLLAARVEAEGQQLLMGDAGELDVIPESTNQDEQIAAAPAPRPASGSSPVPTRDDDETRRGLLKASAAWGPVRLTAVGAPCVDPG